MTRTTDACVPVNHPDRFFIGGDWVAPHSEDGCDVIDAATEQIYFRAASANEADMQRAVAAARAAFDAGPWSRLRHAQRAEYLRAFAVRLRARGEDIAQIWPRQSGALYGIARGSAQAEAKKLDWYADLAASYPFVERLAPTAGGVVGLLVRDR